MAEKAKYRVSDFIVETLYSKGISDVFLLSGGGVMHLIDAVGRSEKVNFIANLHEQACGYAAEGYARIRNNLAACIVTTGPGGTNALTPLINCWLDSVPVVFISGQVKLENTIYKNPGLRQFGDQEINIVDMAKPVSKYAVMITEISKVKYELQKAIYFAREGRPGPVWIDVPLDIQAAEYNPDLYESFVPPQSVKKGDLKIVVGKVIEKIAASKRPLIIAGQGIRLAGAIAEFEKLNKILNIPVVTSILGKDILPYEDELCTGLPGIAGQRGANFACANCDVILSIGSRLMLRQIGFNYNLFARNAYKIVVDIDGNEAKKTSVAADMPLEYDAGDFIKEMLKQIEEKKGLNNDISDWRGKCSSWHIEYNVVEKEFREQKKFINSHFFAEKFSQMSQEDDVVVTSNGTAYIAALQGYRVKKGQRLIYNKASAPMGFGLPAAIGACVANGKKTVYCFENDGSLQMNIQELQTIKHYELPVKMVVFNNDGYLSIKLTQKTFFPDNYTACDPSCGVTAPDLKKICRAYELPYLRLENRKDMDKIIKKFMKYKGQVILEVIMDPWQEFLPKVTSVMRADGTMLSKPLEDMYPFLDREEFKRNMIVDIIE